MADCPYSIDRANLFDVRKQITAYLCDLDARVQVLENVVQIAAHYDFSDTSTFFSDLAGTIPPVDNQMILRADCKAIPGNFVTARNGVTGPYFEQNVHGSLGTARSRANNDGQLNSLNVVLTQTERVAFMAVVMNDVINTGTIVSLGDDDPDTLSFLMSSNTSARWGIRTLTDPGAGYDYATADYDVTLTQNDFHIIEGYFVGTNDAEANTGYVVHDGIASAPNVNMRGGPIVNSGFNLLMRGVPTAGSDCRSYLGEAKVWDGIPTAAYMDAQRAEMKSKWNTV